jgi:uncharacterized ferritin-like protein (DUF455 family)
MPDRENLDWWQVGSVERWAANFVCATGLTHKLAPPPPPATWMPDAAPRSLARPGRPVELARIDQTRRSIPRRKLAQPRYRAQLFHTFWHHELQAAELMCWAILAFSDAPREFRQGLLGICRDELRHMQLYRRHIEALGFGIGDFPVRDWFWERVAACTTPAQFVALMGIGLEGCNLDHTRRFAAWFRAAGDEEGALIQDLVGDEEVAHVRFALRWLRRFTDSGPGEVDFARWRGELNPPLTPTMFRGPRIDTERRRAAGFTAAFLDDLATWDPT